MSQLTIPLTAEQLAGVDKAAKGKSREAWAAEVIAAALAEKPSKKKGA